MDIEPQSTVFCGSLPIYKNAQPKQRKRRRHKGLIDYPTLCTKTAKNNNS
jgi:hypothetical protein